MKKPKKPGAERLPIYDFLDRATDGDLFGLQMLFVTIQNVTSSLTLTDFPDPIAIRIDQVRRDADKLITFLEGYNAASKAQ